MPQSSPPPTAPQRSYPYAAPAAHDSQPGRRTVPGPALPYAPGRPTDPASQATPRRPDAPVPAFTAGSARSGDWEALRPADVPVFEAPVVDADARTTRRRKPLLPLAIGVGALVVAVVAAWQVFGVNRKSDIGVIVTDRTATVTGARITSPTELVQTYFQALQAGDVNKAQNLGPVGTGSRLALSEQSLRASLERTPLTDVRVEQVPDSATEVPVSYKLGGDTTSTWVQVRKQDDGGVLLERSTVTVQVTAKRSPAIPMLINGEKFDANSFEVFPGSYVWTTGLPFLSYEANQLVVSTLDSRPELSLITPALTKEGREALIATGRASLQACIASKELAPQGCPFAQRAPSPIVPGSITWHLTNDPWTNVNPRLSTQKEVAEVVIDLQLAISLRYTNGSSLTRSPVTTRAVSLRVDMSRTTAEELEATWSR